MAKPRKRRRGKRKGRIRISKKAVLVRKGQEINDTTQKAPTQESLPTNSINFKVKIRKR